MTTPRQIREFVTAAMPALKEHPNFRGRSWPIGYLPQLEAFCQLVEELPAAWSLQMGAERWRFLVARAAIRTACNRWARGDPSDLEPLEVLDKVDAVQTIVNLLAALPEEITSDRDVNLALFGDSMLADLLRADAAAARRTLTTCRTS